MRRIILIVLVLMLGTSIVSASRVDNIPMSIKVGIGSNNLTADNITVNGDTSTITSFGNKSSESVIKYTYIYRPVNTYAVIPIPLNITSRFINNTFLWLDVVSGSYHDVIYRTNDNNYFNFTLPFTVTDAMLNSSVYGTINNTDMKAALNEVLTSKEFLDTFRKEAMSSNEDFSSTFIQYFSNQYEPKVSEIKAKDDQLRAKDSQIEGLRNEIQLKEQRITMLNYTYVSAQTELDNAKTENMFLAFFSVVLLVMMMSFMAVKKGFIKTIKGVN